MIWPNDRKQVERLLKQWKKEIQTMLDESQEELRKYVEHTNRELEKFANDLAARSAIQPIHVTVQMDGKDFAARVLEEISRREQTR